MRNDLFLIPHSKFRTPSCFPAYCSSRQEPAKLTHAAPHDRLDDMKPRIHVTVISYAKLQRRYGGKFIARKNGKVLASGSTYPQLLQVIRKRRLNRQRLIVGSVPPQKAICIYRLPTD